MWEFPSSGFGGAQWSYEFGREALARAGRLVDPELGERRNLILANKRGGQNYPTLRTHVLAYQMIMPGERARTHRHTPHAGRVILEADEGAYTVVNGARLAMHPGDVVLTPSLSWHGHGHEGERPAYWIDFLDVPLVHLLEPMFFEPYPGGWEAPRSDASAEGLVFPWAETKAQLDELPKPTEGAFGREVRLGEPALPTMGLVVRQLDNSTLTTRFRTSANREYCVVSGAGESWIDGEHYRWSSGDVFVAPCWSIQQHASDAGAVLLEISDEPLQAYCGYLRSEAVAEIGTSGAFEPEVAHASRA